MITLNDLVNFLNTKDEVDNLLTEIINDYSKWCKAKDYRGSVNYESCELLINNVIQINYEWYYRGNIEHESINIPLYLVFDTVENRFSYWNIELAENLRMQDALRAEEKLKLEKLERETLARLQSKYSQ